ncbi:hypothetical protein CYMTET_55598, partial [Cymbomonas tetramitiformis]
MAFHPVQNGRHYAGPATQTAAAQANDWANKRKAAIERAAALREDRRRKELARERGEAPPDPQEQPIRSHVAHEAASGGHMPWWEQTLHSDGEGAAPPGSDRDASREASERPASRGAAAAGGAGVAAGVVGEEQLRPSKERQRQRRRWDDVGPPQGAGVGEAGFAAAPPASQAPIPQTPNVPESHLQAPPIRAQDVHGEGGGAPQERRPTSSHQHRDAPADPSPGHEQPLSFVWSPPPSPPPKPAGRANKQNKMPKPAAPPRTYDYGDARPPSPPSLQPPEPVMSTALKEGEPDLAMFLRTSVHGGKQNAGGGWNDNLEDDNPFKGGFGPPKPLPRRTSRATAARRAAAVITTTSPEAATKKCDKGAAEEAPATSRRPTETAAAREPPARYGGQGAAARAEARNRKGPLQPRRAVTKPLSSRQGEEDRPLSATARSRGGSAPACGRIEVQDNEFEPSEGSELPLWRSDDDMAQPPISPPAPVTWGNDDKPLPKPAVAKVLEAASKAEGVSVRAKGGVQLDFFTFDIDTGNGKGPPELPSQGRIPGGRKLSRPGSEKAPEEAAATEEIQPRGHCPVVPVGGVEAAKGVTRNNWDAWDCMPATPGTADPGPPGPPGGAASKRRASTGNTPEARGAGGSNYDANGERPLPPRKPPMAPKNPQIVAGPSDGKAEARPLRNLNAQARGGSAGGAGRRGSAPAGNKGDESDPVTRQMVDKRQSRKDNRVSFMRVIESFRKDVQQSGGGAGRGAEAGVDTGIGVYVRKRPQFQHERDKGEYDVVTVADLRSVTVHNCQMYPDLKRMYINHHNFPCTSAFGQDADNAEVYEACGAPLVQFAAGGGMAAMFMYGQTGSGKTHTMSSIEEAGVLELFHHLQQDLEERTVEVSVAFFEIVGKKCADLLGPKRREIALKETEDGFVELQGAEEPVVHGPEELLEYVRCGKARRATAGTDINAQSSR